MSLKMGGIAPLLQVFDMPSSVAFYHEVLGFDLMSRSPEYAPGLFHWALLRRDGITLMLNTAYDEGERPAQPEKARVAAHGDTALYFDCPDVDAAYQHFLDRGLKVAQPRIAPYGMRQLYVKDPDGFDLCFQWPTEHPGTDQGEG